MYDIYECMNKTDNIVRNSPSGKETVAELMDLLRHYLGSCVVLADDKGKVVWGNTELINNELSKDEDVYIDNILNRQLWEKTEPVYNINLGTLFIKNMSAGEAEKYVCMIVPVCAAMKRTGTFVAYRQTGSYTLQEKTAAVYIVDIISVILCSEACIKGEINKRSAVSVKAAMDILSYSELEAVVEVFKDFNGREGMIIASRIADRAGITRSVIVNALRKLESAGVIESRSLGMKGTFIKINNDYLIEEINKLVE